MDCKLRKDYTEGVMVRYVKNTYCQRVELDFVVCELGRRQRGAVTRGKNAEVPICGAQHKQRVG